MGYAVKPQSVLECGGKRSSATPPEPEVGGRKGGFFTGAY
ncbi:hypothetical protein EI77_02479 [Prosthecobacter fusiformis]|uniref:Uncharacterized protein n=1 Tax=Prosthecobacter fusiformis TaxID=48464 RepID=A0A4R7S285_9BACT|nr:hypothetical protein EI77_02479 [Prosthecobacter fusiformis]